MGGSAAPGDSAIAAWSLLRGPGGGHPVRPGDGLEHLADDREGRLLRRIHSGRWIRSLHEIRPFTAAAAGSGMPLWAYKGVDMALDMYPSPDQRPMNDIDLICRRSDFLSLGSLLLSLGWTWSGASRALLSSGIVGSAGFRRNAVTLDLHWHPVYFPSTLPGRLPHPSESQSVPGPENLLFMSLDMRLLLSMLHTVRHGGARQIWWVDAALIASRLDPAGWAGFTRLAGRTGLGEVLARMLEGLGAFPGLHVPVAARDTLLRAGNRPVGRFGPLAPGGSSALSAALALRGWRRSSFIVAALFGTVLGRSGVGLPVSCGVRRFR